MSALRDDDDYFYTFGFHLAATISHDAQGLRASFLICISSSGLLQWRNLEFLLASLSLRILLLFWFLILSLSAVCFTMISYVCREAPNSLVLLSPPSLVRRITWGFIHIIGVESVNTLCRPLQKGGCYLVST
ncbi:uncharacterized protein BDR25DRAFT_357916 [Lindgomyces ingoldianus]|uniref:Uncharacterized protein n=1 Tax=Lindgomyces ingoldianus TaxID=673940 RepID=A0ACB6QPV0_9PLEO|nr:uncharacterized protein BDR25DRAFT_357916 [Lindgomyces ingoldianus]KAF2468171.1 hypothetical protein BDR25DRAFT_357916 [Lindgomyces ingoldianus]